MSNLKWQHRHGAILRADEEVVAQGLATRDAIRIVHEHNKGIDKATRAEAQRWLATQAPGLQILGRVDDHEDLENLTAAEKEHGNQKN